jgi:phosphonate degradation associated HDIG domain protein
VTTSDGARSIGAGSVDEVLELYRTWGHDQYDEALNQLDHALQTAALAEQAGADDALVAAALLHDVGHLLDLRDGGGPATGTDHERRGARWLAPLLPPSVTAPIALHVQAKRYRCAVDPGYFEALSEGSRRSLAVQGGPFDAAAVAAFERQPGRVAAVALRGWDDGGKLDDVDVPGLEHYRPLLQRLAKSAEARSGSVVVEGVSGEELPDQLGG